jgi:hypothetical protein
MAQIHVTLLASRTHRTSRRTRNDGPIWFEYAILWYTLYYVMRYQSQRHSGHRVSSQKFESPLMRKCDFFRTRRSNPSNSSIDIRPHTKKSSHYNSFSLREFEILCDCRCMIVDNTEFGLVFINLHFAISSLMLINLTVLYVLNIYLVLINPISIINVRT